MAKSEATVEELVGMIRGGQLRLPEMQREYVWQAPRVRDLMDSLYRGYPSGAILIWETDEPLPVREFAVQQEGNPYGTTKLLLDGQQRLTSLSAVLRAEPIRVRGRKRPIELLFNLEHPDKLGLVMEVNERAGDEADVEAAGLADATEDELLTRFNQMVFVVATRKLERLPNWVKVSEVFRTPDNRPFLTKAGVTDLNDPRCEKYSQRLNRLRDIRRYGYRMDILDRSLSYEEVTEIFVRVNSLGAKLRGSDLAMAQITAKWRDSLKTFEAFQKECAAAGYELSLGLHVRNLIAFTTGQPRFHTVGQLTVPKLQAGWEQAKEGMRFAINFLKSNVGIEDPALLSSDLFLIASGYLAHRKQYRLTPAEAAELRYWVLVGNAKGRFSRGSSETLLDQDLARIGRGGGSGDLVEALRLQFGRLDIDPGELANRNARSAFFKTMFLAFRQDGARDWTSNLAISLSHGGKQHSLQFHHIFPQAILRGRYKPQLVNDIANLAFIGGRTNRRISSKPPAEYLPPLLASQGERAFEAQCIPVEPQFLELDAYAEFLAERRGRIAERLNRFLEGTRRAIE
jgi:hypothetical protein